MAKRVSIINFKGGVGKTTLAFNFAAGLVRYHSVRVLLVDIDHQSSLSLVCMDGKEWQNVVSAGKTTTDIIKRFMDSKPMPGPEIIAKNVLNNNKYATLDLVPASLDLDNVEIELTSTHKGSEWDKRPLICRWLSSASSLTMQREWNKRTLICRWIEEAKINRKYDYIIFDCPPATKIVSQNAIAASHGYILPVVPEAVMERGAPHLSDMIKNGIDVQLSALAASATGFKRKMHVRNTKLVGVVITKIITHSGAEGVINDHATHRRSLKRVWGNDLIQPYIEHGAGILETLAEGVPVYDKPHAQNVGKRGFPVAFRSLTRKLKTRIDNL